MSRRRWGAGSRSADQGSDAYQLTRNCLATVDPQGYATAYSAFATGDDVYADAWPTVACPALFLTGEHDANSSPQMARDDGGGRAGWLGAYRRAVTATWLI